MVSTSQSPRLVKHIIRSYARLSDNIRVRGILKDNLPQIFKDKIFYQNLDDGSKKWLQILLKSISNVQGVNEKNMLNNNSNNTNSINNNNNNNNKIFMIGSNNGNNVFNSYSSNFINNEETEGSFSNNVYSNYNNYSVNNNMRPYLFKNDK